MVFFDRVVPVVVRAQIRQVFIVVNAPEPRAFLSRNKLFDALVIVVALYLCVALRLALVVLPCEWGVFVAVVLAQILLNWCTIWSFCNSLIILCGGTA